MADEPNNATNATAATKPPELKELASVVSQPQLATARYSPCGRYLFGAAYDATVRRWDVTGDEPKELAPLSGHSGWVSRIAFLPDKRRVVTADTWGALRGWDYDAETPKVIWSHEQAHDGWLRDVAVSLDGERLATCGRDRILRLWAAKDGALEAEFEAGQEDMYVVALHPGGKAVATCDMKGNVTLWDIATRKPVREFDATQLYKFDRIQDVGGVTTLRFEDNGDTLIVAGSTPSRGATMQGVPTILFFDTQTAKLTGTLSIGEQKDGHVTDLCRHPDGFYIAVTSGTPGNGRLLLLDRHAEKPLYENTKLPNCHAVTLHPTGRRLAVTATNRGSNGNGRRLNKDGEYEGNHSPIHFFEFG